MLSPNTLLQNRYLIKRVIAKGGMGRVYEAEAVHLGRTTVAVKETFFDEDWLREQFEREATVLARLRHPALPKVTDQFSEGAGQFLVMEFIPGSDLEKLLLQRGAPFEWRQVAEWADRLLDALDYIHTQYPPVIHRDIKPSNLKLTPRGELILLDFGLAKNATTPTRPGGSVHAYTQGYAPPEQIKGTGTDVRCDIYSLGATLYNLLTNEVPVDGKLRAEMMAVPMPDSLRPAHLVNGQIPMPLAIVIARAMAVDRARRYETAAAMREALQHARQSIEEELREQERQKQKEQEATQSLLEQQRLAEAARQPTEVGTELLQREEIEQQRKEEAERRQKEAERQQRAEAERRRKEEAERQQREEAERKQKEEAERQQRAEAARREQEAAERRQREEAERQQRAARERELAEQRGRAQRVTSTAGRSFEFETVRLDKEGKEVERRKGQARYFSEDLGNGVKLEMVEIPGGKFQMGSNDYEDEKPLHPVSVSSFWIGKYEITQAQWQAVMGSNPSKFKGDSNLPVENVSWNDAQEFLKKLKGKANLQGKGYRLPSEAEWEYAARAGTTTLFAFGDTITPQIVNYHGGLYRQQTMPVSSLPFANAFGLFDMHGNVWEWCQDYWHGDYNDAPKDGSAWLSGGNSSLRVLRGGSWVNVGNACRAANRDAYSAGIRSSEVGFRVAVSSRTQ